MRRLRALAPHSAAISLAVALGCGSPTGLPFTPRDGDLTIPNETIPQAATTETVAAQRATWRASAPRRYLLEQQYTCFNDVRAPVVIEVLDGVVISAWELATGRVLAERDAVRSIEQLFDEALAELARGRSVQVLYDAARGYPTLLQSSQPGTLDSQCSYRSIGFRPR